jgi:hypothetical protein
MASIPVHNPETQIAFALRIAELEDLQLTSALSKAVAAIQVTKLDGELGRLVPNDRLGRLAAFPRRVDFAARRPREVGFVLRSARPSPPATAPFALLPTLRYHCSITPIARSWSTFPLSSRRLPETQEHSLAPPSTLLSENKGWSSLPLRRPQSHRPLHQPRPVLQGTAAPQRPRRFPSFS